MAEIKDWSVTAGNNNSSPPDGWPENMAYSQVNNAARENMAVIARHYQDTNGTLTSGGSSNAYTLTPNRTLSAYTDGDCFRFEASFTNTDSATLNVSSLGAKTIVQQNGDTLSGGEIVSGGRYFVCYDGSNFQLFNPSFDGQRVFYKTADQTSTSSIASDNHLSATVNGSTQYFVELKLYFTVGGTSEAWLFDLKDDTGNETGVIGDLSSGGAVTSIGGAGHSVTTTDGVVSGLLNLYAIVTTGSAATTLTFEWFGGSAVTGFNTLKQGCLMTVTELA